MFLVCLKPYVVIFRDAEVPFAVTSPSLANIVWDKGRTLPTIRWQASREGVCLVGARVCFDEEMKTHTELGA